MGIYNIWSVRPLTKITISSICREMLFKHKRCIFLTCRQERRYEIRLGA